MVEVVVRPKISAWFVSPTPLVGARHGCGDLPQLQMLAFDPWTVVALLEDSGKCTGTRGQCRRSRSLSQQGRCLGDLCCC